MTSHQKIKDRNIDKYTEMYFTHDFEDTMVFYRRKKVLEILNEYKPKNILEIGCGLDSIANYYKTFNTFTIIEPSTTFAQKAENDLIVQNPPPRNKNVIVINDFIENRIDDLKNQNFDFIILSSLLHEVNDVNNFIKQVVKLLDNNTILHINVPNSKSFHLIWAYESGLIQNMGKLTKTAKSLQQNTTFDTEKLNKFVNENGLEILQSGSYFIKPFNHAKMALLLKEQVINKELLDGLYYITKYMPNIGAEIFVNCKNKI